MRYLGLYSAVYKTTREGQFEALLDDIRIQLDVKFEKVDDDVLHMGGSKFRFVTHGGGMRYLGLYSAVYKTTREGQFEALLDDIRIQLDVKFEKVDDDVLESAGAPCIVRHENAAWRFDTKGVKLSFKRSSPREKRSASGTSVKEIEVRVQPRHLDSRVTEAPFLEIKAHSAYLHLTLHTVLSYQNRAAHHRIPYLRLGTYMKLRIADLFVDPSDVGGRYKWSARFEIVDLKVSYRFRRPPMLSSNQSVVHSTHVFIGMRYH
ncbi:hypothetical protein ANCCEY_01848 [Ancylostoma ceylanicum]|uniref:Uncharacterized protein n=1 Tax=Ancylostoma ceylanicum TaxID=53326 RepID=A0A0D6M4M6_9BILA|nr:hypothetical protein ANCCEY_01848 [Ancylostoma ceylanicum]